MLIELFGKNFGCFRDEFRLSMLATDIDPGSTRGIVEVEIKGDDKPLRLLRAVAIYGPNGSGKSTVLRAAKALRYLIGQTARLRSDSPIGPYEPFALGSNRKAPVQLGLKAVIDGHVFEYSVEFEQKQFRRERLVELGVSDETVLFDRTAQKVTGLWKDDDSFALLAKDFRTNALLLSLADRLAPSLAKNIAVGFRGLLQGFDPTNILDIPPWLQGATHVAQRVQNNPKFSAWLRTQLRAADIGVVDLRTEEVRIKAQTLYAPEGDDSDDETATPTYQLSLLHQGEGGHIPLSYAQESLGTRRLVELSPLMYDLAHATDSHAAFVDEIDASMHPALLLGLIRHFNCEIPLSQARGQLIFATHETTLMDDQAKDAVLRRDQIYFTEKDATGAARLFSVAEYNERNNLNIRRRYLQGRYGALPSLGSFTE
ncbi:MAG: AAA family ATPase [Phycisphaeraceae bacterium]|nr:AAA family ATPase [Phycisphaeraceae bacterium]